MRKIGTIYEQIANTCLTEWYPDMSESDRKALLERGDFEEVEGYIGAKNSIDAAIESIGESLERYQVFLPADFSDVVYFSDTPNADVEKLTIKINKNICEYTMASIAFEALHKIHLRWIDDNKDKFFDPKRREKRFMFLPIEMISWEEALKDYVFLRPILQLLCIRPETYAIQKFYEKRQGLYTNMLGKGYTNVATMTIRQSLLHIDRGISDAEIEEVTRQAITRCPAFEAK